MGKIINYNIVFRVLSRILFIVSGSLISCIIVALIYSEPVGSFVVSSAISLITGFLFHLLVRRVDVGHGPQRKDAYLTVTLAWLFISLAGTLPYVISGAIPSFVDAFFESVSGFTTTGASILTDIEALPLSILFWRSLTHWIGGIGIIVLVIVAMHNLKSGGYQLFVLESSLQEKFKPRIKMVGSRLVLIYIILTVAEVILLLAGGMSPFESVCHAFATISTGGFSPKNSSIAGYSPYIHYVIMVFMLLSGANFVVHYFFLKRDFRKVWEKEEFRFYLKVVLIIGIFISATLFLQMNKPLEVAFREGFFQVISIVTCTGFATADYLQWPQFAWLIIFFAMFLGGSTGSTAGGIKMARLLVLYKNLTAKFRKMMYPNAIIPVRINHKSISEQSNSSILSFINAYLIVFITVTVILVILGTDFQTSASAVATCMANIGPGIGTIGPVSNFAHLPEAVKVILSLVMIVGRLEIYTVLVLFTRNYWSR
ncbi:MAG: TrkH family potassium uptake protein [Bacteroidales bacterium]|nr:TrkH family potassium uptake protein [Bacteroidales bacterium]